MKKSSCLLFFCKKVMVEWESKNDIRIYTGGTFLAIRKEVVYMDQELKRQELIVENGQIIINGNKEKYNILLLDIIGEIEGHVSLPSDTKTTKYEHVLPELAVVQDDESIKGVLVLLNTVGGDVEAGLAIAEMLASISKPVVTLVLGGSHSIGVPLAVSGDVSFIVPTATMVVHPL